MMPQCALIVMAALGPGQAAHQAAQQVATCASAGECRQLTREAIAARQYERAHDLAWLAFQKAARADLETMTLLARTQSLSGRADDAHVMLRRIAEAGGVVDDVHDSEDFRRVRSDSRWSELAALFATMGNRSDVASTPPAPKAAARPAAPARADPEPRKVEPAPPSPAASAPASPIAPPDLPSPAPADAAGATEGARPASEAASTATLPRAADDLTFPAVVSRPVAIAYDSVSARFVLASAESDALTVLSQTSTNAASFTRRGWSSGDTTTALAIDAVRGDLWVAVSGASGDVLHRLQLISGRRLDAIDATAATGSEPTRLGALAVAADGVFVLDRTRPRVLRRTPQTNSLSLYAALPPAIKATSLATARSALYVAHQDGLLRIESGSRRVRSVTAGTGVDLSGLHSAAWHDGVLWAIQRAAGELHVVRVQLNPAGTTATRLERLGPASADAATLSVGVYYILSTDESGAVVVRAIDVRKVASPGR